jgi:hypothetical protein
MTVGGICSTVESLRRSILFHDRRCHRRMDIRRGPGESAYLAEGPVDGSLGACSKTRHGTILICKFTIERLLCPHLGIT